MQEIKMKNKVPTVSLLLLIVLSVEFAMAQEPVAVNGKFATVNGAKIYYEEYGQGEPLFLLHGFGATGSSWKSFIPEFAKKYRVIVWDMRGHGRSTNPDTSAVFRHATAARDLLALMDNLKLNKVKLIGHSSGGIVTLYAATMQPDRFEAIVPVSGQIYGTPEVREFIKQNANPATSQNPNPDAEKQHGKVKQALLEKQFYNFHRLTDEPSISKEQLAGIKARTLIIHGDNDFVPVLQAWEMFQNIPGAHLFVVPNAGHFPLFGPLNETAFTQRTLEFLNGELSYGFPK